MAKVLVVEDNANIGFIISTCLESDRHVVDFVQTGNAALASLRTSEYDVIVLDWNLPDISGVEICRQLRDRGNRVPVIMLTANSTSQYKVEGLDAGADDFVVKPFDPPELLARVRAVLRRPQTLKTDLLTCCDIEFDINTLTVKRGELEADLSVKEAAILELFMRHPGVHFSAEAIVSRLWPSDTKTSPETVRSHIKNLRKKINDADGSRIRLIRGFGYSMPPHV